MLRLDKNSNSDKIVLTLNDSITITNPFYLLVFTHDTTGEVIKIIFSSTDDESYNIDRYNLFIIDTALFFDTASPGDWKYIAYEQDDESNMNPAGLNELENGKMVLAGEPILFSENNNIDLTFIENNG